MARPLRFEYAGALYHVMARGDGGKAIFIAKADHLLFLHRLSEVCRSHSGKALAAHGEREAERLVATGLRVLKLCDENGKLLPVRKGDPRKVALATLVRTHTVMGNEWVAKRLEMGHDRSVSRLIRQGADHNEVRKCRRNLERKRPKFVPLCVAARPARLAPCL